MVNQTVMDPTFPHSVSDFLQAFGY